MRPACAVAVITALTVGGVSFANGMTPPLPSSHQSSNAKTATVAPRANATHPASDRKKPKKKRKAAKKLVVRGTTGPRGPQGVPGFDGAAGATGATGATGALGLTGDAGAPGADGADGTPGTTAVTRIETGAATDNTVTGGAFEQLRAVGSFSKASASSRVKLTWNGHVRGTGVIATDWFCDFQLRVDGTAPPGTGSGGGRAVLYAGGGLQNDAPAGDTAFFNGLAAGSHPITIWVRGSASTLTCEINHGDLPDEVFVEEMPS